jgi:hypothetical protein
VKTSAVNTLDAGTHEFRNEDNDVVAIIARGNYTVGDAPATAVSSGHRQCNRKQNFTGLIVSAGTRRSTVI